MENSTPGSLMNSVHLRDVIEDDLPVFFEHQRDPVATRMTSFTPRDWEAFMAHWARISANDAIFKKTILFNGQVAGNIASYEHSGEREIGYWIGQEYWGKGVATQALAEFLSYEKQRPIYAHVARHNVASRRVLEKCGFTICGEDKGLPDPTGEQVDEFILILR